MDDKLVDTVTVGSNFYSKVERFMAILNAFIDFIQPGATLKHCKEGTESSAFWFALGGKQNFSSKKSTQDVIHHASFSAPTPIQTQSWSIVLRGRDIMAIAKTGSGKTVGFLMPGFVVLKRNHNNSKMGPTVLILSQTRELATQIQDEAVKFGKSSRISCVDQMHPCSYAMSPWTDVLGLTRCSHYALENVIVLQ
ncbi:hypothetical protein ZIOFF_032117 [Zingiber officinale]|uniref:DEAD/DEAH-box helicase domain-containing protein n=1 Tax=Zingiber officinale TaxID=94328 RepID=A0A8J5GHV0_ZINOF|nr:hypothetical protein ZIOFF_032117 [Zingiber officinale]